MKDSHLTVTLTPLQTSSACPRLEALHEKRLLTSLVLSVSVRLAESRSRAVSEHAAVSGDERPPPPDQRVNSNTNTSIRRRTFVQNEQADMRAAENLVHLPVSKHTPLPLSL